MPRSKQGRGPSPRVAYFSMEVALEPHIPTYSGGLGVLAGDSLRSAADLCLPVVGVTLAHRAPSAPCRGKSSPAKAACYAWRP